MPCLTTRPSNVGLPIDRALPRWTSGTVTVSASRLVNDWARLIHRGLSSENFAFLHEELARPRADFALADLPLLGLQLLDEFEAGTMQQPQRQAVHARQSHAAHRRFQKSLAAESTSDASVACGPSQVLEAESPEIVAKLEALDDAVFDAIQGKAAALADLHRLWPVLRTELGDVLLAESREQYIRYALSIWHEPANIKGDHDPIRAVNALEVLCVLFDEAG